MQTYRVELSNYGKEHRNAGTFFGVGRYSDGCRCNYVLEPQLNEAKARYVAATLNKIASSDESWDLPAGTLIAALGESPRDKWNGGR